MPEQERSFRQVFGEGQPELSLEDSPLTIRNTIYGAALMLQENPSESAIAESIAFFATKPRVYLDHAYDAVYFGDGNGIDESGPLPLMRSIITAAHEAYDMGRKTVNPDFDAQTHAEFIFDHLQLEGVERKWKDMDEELHSEKDPSKRVALAEEAKQHVLSHIETNSVVFERANRRVIPTWENISSWGVDAMLIHRHAKTKVESLTKLIGDSRRIMERAKLDSVLEQLPNFDREHFDKLRLAYGAKGANLIILQELAPKINSLLIDRSPNVPEMKPITIPEFLPLPVDIYRKWEHGEIIDEELMPYFEWTNSLKIDGSGFYVDEPDRYIVRSSAVNSEDGEALSGAGIYDSVAVDYDDIGKFNTFKDAVVAVFSSTNSDRAKSYREKHDIPFEEMGLVIQRMRPDKYARRMDHKQRLVTVNSSTAGVPGLVEVIDRGTRRFVKKSVVDEHLASGVPSSAIHFGIDRSRFESGTGIRDDQIVGYAVFTAILERVWHGQIQLECVGDEIVQVRKVTDIFEAETIEFPNLEEIARGNGIGVGDKILTVLESEDDLNKHKTGLVQYFTNYAWTVNGNNDFLPEDGAVVIQTTEEGNAHLQTLSAEKGLLCVYPFNEKDEPTLPKLEIGEEVRVVSNGIEARIYRLPRDEFKENDSLINKERNDIL